MKIKLATQFNLVWIDEDNPKHCVQQGNKYLIDFFGQTEARFSMMSVSNGYGGLDVDNGGFFSFNLVEDFEVPSSHQRSSSIKILVETPEVNSARDALCYQRAMEELLKDAADSFEEQLPEEVSGYLRITKCPTTDADHAAYSSRMNPQESYQFVVFGWQRWLVRFVHVLMAMLVVGLILPLERWTACIRRVSRRNSRYRQVLMMKIEQVGQWLLRSVPLVYLHNQLDTFVLSRLVLAGSGLVDADSQLRVSNFIEPNFSESYHKLLFLTPITPKVILEKIKSRGLVRGIKAICMAHPFVVISSHDANRCHIADFLKYGSSTLLVEMAQECLLTKMPTIIDHQAALVDFSGCDGWKVRVAMSDGKERSAIEIQELYLRQAAAWVKSRSVISTENHEIIQLWSKITELMRTGAFQQLFGKIDWVTKQSLIHMCSEFSDDEYSRIDASYHDIREGAFWLMECEDLVPHVVENDEIIDAMSELPRIMPSSLRSAVIKHIVDDNYETDIQQNSSGIQRVKVAKLKSEGAVIPLFD